MAIRSYLQFVLSEFRRVFHLLGVKPGEAEIESMALLVYEAMSGPKREFHSLDHVFQLSQGQEARESLAAFFHDVVYFQVDQGLPPRISRILEPWLERRPEGLQLRGPSAFKTVVERCALELFGFRGDELLSLKDGLNEFLSALSAVHCLSPWLGTNDMVSILCCIEATIPFRNGPQRRKSIEILKDRLSQVNARHQLGLDPGVQDDFLLRAAALANRDVGSFAQPSVSDFLVDSFRLFVESNPHVRAEPSFHIRPLRDGFLRQLNFFRETLDPEAIFQQYNRSPSEELFLAMRARATENIGTGVLLIGAKLYVACLLDALAQQSGGDCPYFYLVGEPTNHHNLAQTLAEVELSRASSQHPEPEEKVLLSLLSGGRDLSERPLMKLHARLTAEVIRLASEQEFLEQRERTLKYCLGELSAETFLQAQPLALLQLFATGIKKVATPRAQALEVWTKNQQS